MKRQIFSWNQQENKTDEQWRYEIFEPIKGCKNPLIVSGATPIGSAGRAPDEVLKEEKEIQICFFKKMMNKAILLSLYSKKFDYSLGG
jgi:hypothetical protein